MEPLQAILAVLLTPYAIIALALWAMLLESTSNREWAFIITAIATVAAYYTFEVNAEGVMWSLLAYLPIGIAWSVYRWKLQVNDAVKEFETADPGHSNARRHARNKAQVDRYKGRLVYWAAMWPVSLAETFLGDVFRAVQHIVTEWFGSLYRSIAVSGTNKMDSMEAKERKQADNLQD